MAVVPYPHPQPAPNSNAIGVFKIGISPIGTITPWDPFVTVLSQYGSSPILLALITAYNAAIDQTANFDALFDDAWLIDSAQGEGLDSLGRIVGVQRTLQLPGESEYLGFQEAGTSWTGFGQGIFYSGGSITTNYDLNDNDFRRLILAKAATNIWDGSIPGWNKILLNLFQGRGTCYVRNNRNMSVTLVFQFVISIQELAIITTAGALPQPCGVAIEIQQVVP